MKSQSRGQRESQHNGASYIAERGEEGEGLAMPDLTTKKCWHENFISSMIYIRSGISSFIMSDEI